MPEQPATAEKSHAPSQFKMARLVRELEGLLLLEGAEPYRKLWQELKLEVSKPLEVTRVTADNAHIAELTNAVKAMVSKQKQQAAAPMGANTYAAALRFGAATAAAGSPSVREIPTRLAREIVIRCPNATPEDRARPISRLVEEINKKKSQEVSGKVLAARRLPSGDIVVTTNTEKAKEQLEQDSSWLAAVSKEAQVNRRRFPVMVHGMRVAALDCTKQKEAIQQLMGQNRHLKGRIEILHAQWPKRAIKLNKAVTCLIVDVASPAQVNTLIDEGLLFQSELKHCELYHGDCRLTQCFKCQKYGHTARVCRQNQKCGLCATPGHDDHSCAFRNEPNRHRCANCGGPHPAWSSRCKARQEQVEKARLAYSTRPRRYAGAPTVSVGLDKNIRGSLPQTCLSQSSMASTASLNEAVRGRRPQSESGDAFQKPTQNGDRGRHPQTSPSQLQGAGDGAPPTSEFTFTQTSAVDSQVLVDCSQEWQTVQPRKRKRTGSKSTPSSSTGSQSSSKSVKILTRPRTSQNRKGPGRPRILSQAATDELNIAEFFTQDTIS